MNCFFQQFYMSSQELIFFVQLFGNCRIVDVNNFGSFATPLKSPLPAKTSSKTGKHKKSMGEIKKIYSAKY